MGTYGLLVVAIVLLAAGAAWFSPGAGLLVLGAGCAFVWWDKGEVVE